MHTQNLNSIKKLQAYLMGIKKSNKKRLKWHNYRSQRIGSKPKRSRTYDPDKRQLPIHKDTSITYRDGEDVIAPANLCLSENMEECLFFFKKLRRERSIYKTQGVCYVKMSIENVERFDYSSICVLSAIINDLNSQKIYLRGNLPKNKECLTLIEESGLLNNLCKEDGKPFRKSKTSELHFIETGSKKFTSKDNRKISETVKRVVGHLTDNERHCKKLRKIILEICGNSIEWGGTYKRQWLLGIKYDEDKVVFTITDVGDGILKTLNIKFRKKLSHLFKNTAEHEILMGAFEKKYGSRSKKGNRNRGLPAVKEGYDSGLMNNLRVLTNNVFLHFDNRDHSKVLAMKHEFHGTLYRWEVTKDTISKNL